ncbi:MAG: PAS domain S-box protein [Leptolyngbyaceae cyanobacterium SM1_3_5]|nr:PAS domain S-box protein [Leptolyngbyaceae cyanobacterium SM1_3_5]
MQTLVFSAINGFISVSYLIIGLLMMIPFLRGQLKTPLVLATILVFFSCALGHGAHAVLMGSAMPHLPSSWLNAQIGIDLTTAMIAATYIRLRRSYSFLIDGPLLLTQTQNQLAQANAELERVNINLEQLVQARTAELSAINQQLEQEIRDRTLAETALQNREAQLHSINTVVPGVIYQYRIDLDTGNQRFDYLSPGTIALFEREPAAMQSITAIEDLFHPDDFRQIQASVSLSVRDRTRWHDEFRIRTSSGVEKWVRGIAEPMESPPGVAIYSGIFLDVSDRKQAEAALAASERQFRGIVENANDLIFALRAEDLHISYISPQFADFWGYAPDEFIGQSFAPLIHPDDLGICVAEVQALLQTGEKYAGLEFRIVQKSGAVRWVTSNKTPVFDASGRMIEIQGILRDITDRKQAEIQLQQQTCDLQKAIADLQQAQLQLVQREKMSSLGKLVAGIAHEINNPVGFISGNLTPANEYVEGLMQLLALYQQHYPEPPAKIAHTIEQIDLDFITYDLPRLLDSMRVGADRIQKIVLSLRNFSRMDESDKKIVDLHEGIDSTLLILQSQLKATGRQQAIEIIKDYSELPPIECYAGQLNQVFMNLLTNAIDALGDRRRSSDVLPQILIRTRHSDFDQVTIEITDNGAGIPLEIQPQIFDPFFTTKPVGAGTGLGLAISYQIMEKHQGALTCASRLGQGTTFRIDLPLQAAFCRLVAV